MNKYERNKLLINVARLYYIHDLNQNMIAQKLNLSRPYVSKLIAEARAKGLVSITVHDIYETESKIEKLLRQKYNLERVIAVPNEANGDALAPVGMAAARYLDSIVETGDIIGVAWGSTLYVCAINAIPRDDLSNITVVQLCGGISNIEQNIYASEIPKLFADALGGCPYIMPLPAVIDDVRIKEAIVKEKSIENVLKYAERANIALFTMGTFEQNGALARAGYLDDEQVQRLRAAGAVGDICTRIIDSNGKICDPDLDSRTIAIGLDQLKEKKYRIGVAIGTDKVKCIHGGLVGGYANVLVTDERTAEQVLAMK